MNIRQKDRIAYALVAFVVLSLIVGRLFLYRPFNIPSGSNEPTLLVGDYFIADISAYGYSKYSFPLDLGSFSGRIWANKPSRGDVVVFMMPNPNSPDYGQNFIKRLIGLPGDRIQMVNGTIYLNGKPVPRVRVDDYIEKGDNGAVSRVLQYRETLPDGKSYFTLARQPDGPANNTDVFNVPPDHYFVLGDNRDDSDDSRLDVGYVPAEYLVGRATTIFFSTNGGASGNPLSRVFKSIE